MKRWKKVTIICICVIVGILFVFRYVADLGMWSGTSFDTYKEKAYRGQFCDELPNDSKDFRFYCFNSGFGAYSMAAFTLDGKDYDDYIDGIPGKYSKANDEYGCTGKRVSETYGFQDNYGVYTGFPQTKFSHVIDDSIDNYIIIYYDSYKGAGTKIFAIVTNPDTGRIIIYAGGSN